MARSNHERVGKTLELLNQGLRSFIERALQAVHGAGWQDAVQAGLHDSRASARGKGNAAHWDMQTLLGVMWEQWNLVFRTTLGAAERSLVSELREARNKWAHQEVFSTDDAYRALDSMQRLLTAIAALEASELDRQKQELLRVRSEEQARREHRRASGVSLEGQPAGGSSPGVRSSCRIWTRPLDATS